MHVTTWEEEALKHLPAILEGRRPPRYSVTYGGIDAFNALLTAKKAGLSLADVHCQQDEIHRQIVETVVRTPDAQLVSETRYRRRLRLDTYGHYPKHAQAIRRWRAQRQGGPWVLISGASPSLCRRTVRHAQNLELLESAYSRKRPAAKVENADETNRRERRRNGDWLKICKFGG